VAGALLWVFAAGRAGFGRVICRDAQAYAYILESLKHYPAQRGVAAKMHELGCRDVRIIPLLGGVMTINLGVKP
jgi:ubiquinone/menaquinone biosynthesis C-methylase UbiE